MCKKFGLQRNTGRNVGSLESGRGSRDVSPARRSENLVRNNAFRCSSPTARTNDFVKEPRKNREAGERAKSSRHGNCCTGNMPLVRRLHLPRTFLISPSNLTTMPLTWHFLFPFRMLSHRGATRGCKADKTGARTKVLGSSSLSVAGFGVPGQMTRSRRTPKFRMSRRCGYTESCRSPP